MKYDNIEEIKVLERTTEMGVILVRISITTTANFTVEGFGETLYNKDIDLSTNINNAVEDAVQKVKNRYLRTTDGVNKKSRQQESENNEENNEESNGFFCSDCGAEIDNKVYHYSLKKYGKALCRDCQKLQ